MPLHHCAGPDLAGRQGLAAPWRCRLHRRCWWAVLAAVRAIFFAMITLAVASAFLTLASQLHEFTGGEDGLTFKVPEILSPSFEFSEEPFLGVSLDGRLLCYYLLFVTAVVLFLALLRIVNSPFGHVLQAIRENEFRAEVIATVWWCTAPLGHFSALFACMAGAMLAPGCATTGRIPRCPSRS